MNQQAKQLIQQIEADVQRALAEDLGDGDVSAALLSPEQTAEAKIISREPMVVCGSPWAEQVFKTVNPQISCEWKVQEGQWLSMPAVLCVLRGPAAAILSAERTALNFLQTLSGTATLVHDYVAALRGTTAQLLDTRKTLPGLRRAQKYAVHCAGGMNHRMGLYDAFLIKENHIKAAGSITLAVQKARQMRADLMVEVEVETLQELEEALAVSPDRILLDNFDHAALLKAVAITKGRCPLEVSGGVTLASIGEIAMTGVNYISVGAITKSVEAIDLSLMVENVYL